MTPAGGRKLIEVALPVSDINDASAYDKLPGIGAHPKNIHQWWARLPLPTARAVIFASLIDDPSADPAFARASAEKQGAERERLFGVLRKLLIAKPHENPKAFQAARQEIKRCLGSDFPLFLDPFCGGGSIPLEAQRLGLRTLASDLNPVATVLTKALVDFPCRFARRPPINPAQRRQRDLTQRSWSGAEGLAEDVRFYGNWVREEAEKRIGSLYPRVKIGTSLAKARPDLRSSSGRELAVIAWLWARSVKCPNPACRRQMPMVRNFNLSTRKGREAWVEPEFDAESNTIRMKVNAFAGKPRKGTVANRAVTCLACGNSAGLAYIREEAQRGRMAVLPLAIVADDGRSRVYLPFPGDHAEAALSARPRWKPTEKVTTPSHDVDRLPMYGMYVWGDAFTPRQLVAMTTFSDLIGETIKRMNRDALAAGLSDDDVGVENGGTGARGYAEAVGTYLAFALDRLADFNCGLSRWKPSGEQQMQLFGRQAIPMVWDFAEANVFGLKGITWQNQVKYVADAIETITIGDMLPGEVAAKDVVQNHSGLSNLFVCTDPPYYDNIGYADLSDFFYVWLRRTLRGVWPSLFSTLLTPKTQELVATPHRFDGDKEKAKAHFEQGFRKAFASMREIMDPRFPLTLFYAFKQEEAEEDVDEEGVGVTLTTGWETFLEGLVSAGFQVTATMPVRASQKWRLVAVDTNALASYIVLACRVRSPGALPTTRREFVAALRQELPGAIEMLQHGNIAPVDLAQASIGPGMATFSRYSRVVEAHGSAMTVRTALQLINQVLDEFLARQEGELDPDTRAAVTWFEQHSFEEGPFGEIETLVKARNTSAGGMVQAGIAVTGGGKFRLLKRSELSKDWDPVENPRITVWDCVQHTIRVYQDEGEEAAGRLVARMGERAEDARSLMYRLFTICERKGWTEEARVYNELITAWPVIREHSHRAGEEGKGPLDRFGDRET